MIANVKFSSSASIRETPGARHQCQLICRELATRSRIWDACIVILLLIAGDQNWIPKFKRDCMFIHIVGCWLNCEWKVCEIVK
jgi:hypothetical protein